MNKDSKTSPLIGTGGTKVWRENRSTSGTHRLSGFQLQLGSEGRHRVFFFFEKRWQSGVLSLVSAIILAAGGTLFLSQLGKSASLMVQMTVLGAGLWAGAIYLLSVSAGDLGGFLRLDSYGVHIRRNFTIQTIPWDRVESWRITGDALPFEINRTLQINPVGDEAPLVIHCEYFRSDFLPILQTTLLFFAPFK